MSFDSQLVVQDGNFNVASLMQEHQMISGLCKSLIQSKHYQKLGEDGIFAIVQMAKTLDINPLHALNGELYFTQGRVGMYAETMSKYVRMKGHSIVTKELTATRCVIQGTRKDNGDTATITYTIQDAQKAGLIKPNSPWDKHPMSMLWSRAMTLLKKILFSDLLANVLTSEELKDMEREKEFESKQSNQFLIQEQPATLPSITQDQAFELHSLLAQCEPSYKEQVLASLRSMQFDCIEALTPVMFERVKKAAEKKKAEYQGNKEIVLQDTELEHEESLQA